MNRNYFLAIVFVALACLFLIFFSVGKEIQTPITKKPSTPPPPLAPYKTYITGVGIVEARSGNIFIGTPLNRIVRKVMVKEGQKVKKGEVLFRLEDSDLEANLQEQKIAYKSALARLKRLEALPRPEDLAAAQAVFKSSKAEMNLAKSKYDMVLSLSDSRAISQEEKNRRLSDYHQAEAKLEQTQADLDKIKMGSWKPDLEIALLEIQQAEANAKRIKSEIARTIISSPIDGTILQIKIHEGESPQDPLKTPLMIIGNIDTMHIRVSINQLDIPYFRPEAPAVAFPQGDVRFKYPLEFVRIEPFLVNKQNFTNEISETVNTRVLQIIYAIKKEVHPLYVGQQMDVFIETK